VLPQAVVEQALAPFMGPARSFKDIDAAREALEKAFQDAGYLSVVVSLPNQRVDSGEVLTSLKCSKSWLRCSLAMCRSRL
jgi:hemolysin activation/secretion protein